ncbi:MAG: metal dependent phosphohydrolase [Bacteroidetes bacterium]|nr:metal dependent phosphohydrolase [Bacteroidota bacterium]
MHEATAGALSDAPAFVASLLTSRLPPQFTFRTFERTEGVAKLCAEIAEGSRLKRGELDVLLLSAWFIDTGFTESAESYGDHSVRIAAGFLEQRGVPDDVVARVAACIRAVARHDPPASLLEEILSDARTAFVGKKNFRRAMGLLRLEEEAVRGRQYSEAEWLERAAQIVAERTFHTEYARARFEKRRADRLVWLREELGTFQEQKEARQAKDTAKRALLEAKSEKERRPERGIETLFRTAPQNHLNLSSIADQKANILITVNALVISIVLTQMFQNLDEIKTLLVPTLILLGVCMLTIVFATLATKPKITSGTFTREDINNKKANLLFFGNFYKMSLEDFEWGMNAMMNDREYLYGAMIRDFFSLGQVVGRKYFHLRIAYIVFMYGIGLAVLSFVIVLLG